MFEKILLLYLHFSCVRQLVCWLQYKLLFQIVFMRLPAGRLMLADLFRAGH